MNKPIINLDEIPLPPRPDSFRAPGAAAEKFDARMGTVSARIGAQKLGYNITEVPPGKRAFPLHSHRINEEMFFILEGCGEVRIGDRTHPLRTGDFLACPPGGPDTAHQIINTGDTVLRYLAVSTQETPDICEYPDSGKFAVIDTSQKYADGQTSLFRFVSRESECLPYWDGE